ncbi:hypothetical protein RBSH_02573 [Rhodopirellula baltica SH28]|uniref:Uncharacterized protein n=1 Tax=Rhodopirellula baltica SH28 TaxID=993517 RepID=K5CE52_RHOBT|nr:hypothetical protein RBSH_02573 [Rhodopirellula baltica SH28]
MKRILTKAEFQLKRKRFASGSLRRLRQRITFVGRFCSETMFGDKAIEK